MEAAAAESGRGDGFVCLDLETTGLMEPGAPLPQVLCAATLVMNRIDGVLGKFSPETTITWPRQEGPPEVRPPRAMSTEELLVLVDYLWQHCAAGELRVLAWNGVGYDLKLLYMHFVATAADNPCAAAAADKIKQLTMGSCDPMLAFAFGKGFPVGLQAAAEVLPSGAIFKTGQGAECNEQWMEGTDRDRLAVLQYCANDVEMTAMVFCAAEAAGSLRWCSKGGKLNEWRPPRGAQDINAPVHRIMNGTFADNSFMRRDRATGQINHEKSVPTAEQFVGWLR